MKCIFNLLISGIMTTCILPRLNAQGYAIEWEDPIEVATSEYGQNNLRMELDSEGLPIVLLGMTGPDGGLYSTRWNGLQFDTPVPITQETGLFINDSQGARMAVYENEVLVSYQISGAWAQGGRTTRSVDSGQNWLEPVSIAPEAIEDHFMPAPAFDENGLPWVAVKWGINPVLEGVLRWDEATQSYGPAEDGGFSFPGGIACDCCASMPFEHEGVLYNAVRINNNNTRDFHLARTDASGQWSESLDIDPTNWILGSCPASKTEMALLGDGQFVFVFMSGAEGGSRTYWSIVNPDSWSLSGSDRIQPGNDFIENNPSVAAHGDHCVSAWERNDGGYDIVVGISENTGDGMAAWANSNDVVTSSLNGHSRRPVIRIHNNTVHLVYQRPSEGIVHYRRGTVVASDVPTEVSSMSWTCQRREFGWLIHGCDTPFEWTLFNAVGQIIDSGKSADSMVQSTETGWGILEIQTGNVRRAFHVNR